MPPTTPAKQLLKAGDTPFTPTPARQGVWREKVLESEESFQDIIQQGVSIIHDIAGDDGADIDEKSGAMFLMFRSMAVEAEALGIGAELFNLDTALTNDSNAEDENEESDEDDDNDDDDDDDFVVGDGTYDQTISGRSRRKKRATTHTNANSWGAALAEYEMVAGNGSEEEPWIVGGKLDKSGKVPTLHPCEMDIDAELSADRMRRIQATLFKNIMEMVWVGSKSRKQGHMRLHPFAVTHYTNLFTTRILSKTGLQKINNVITALAKVSAAGSTQLQLNQAESLAKSSKVSQIERDFYHSMAAVIRGELGAAGSFGRFKYNHECASFVVKYERFCDMVQDPGDDPKAQEARRSIQPYIRVGVSLREAVAASITTNMDLTPHEFHAILRRHRPLAQICETFTGALLLLTDSEILKVIQNNGASCIPSLVEIVRSTFPKLEELMVEIHQILVPRLLSVQREKVDEIIRQKVETGGTNDFLSRIRAIRSPSLDGLDRHEP